MKNKSKVMLLMYVLLLLALTIYSYALIDPNLTLLSNPIWEQFRGTLVNFGYLNRPDSWPTYLFLVSALFIFHEYFMKSKIKVNPFRLSVIMGAILLISYPLLSHDLFNYIFDAKIFTMYGKNPYTTMPVDIAGDPWLRFMHWTDRTYPYGPTFLPITIAISYLALGKFILNYIAFKALFVITYIGSVYVLQKMNKKWALFFATSPLVIVEGVINAHNDLLAVFFGFVGIYFLAHETKKGKQLKARIALLISGGIKYFSLPTLILTKPQKSSQSILVHTSALTTLGLILYVSFTQALQPWYFLNMLIFIPYYFSLIQKFNILTYGLLISYYPIIRFGVWEPDPGVNIKNIIVYIALAINILYLIYSHSSKTKEL